MENFIIQKTTADALANALNKYKLLNKIFIQRITEIFYRILKCDINIKYKTRFLGKVRQRLFFIPE